MKKQPGIFGLFCTATALFASSAFAEGKISGLVLGDAYWFAKNHDAVSIKSQNGLWIRRAYFTYDNKMDEEWSTRFRLEANSPDFATTTATAMTPYVKDAYLQWTVGSHKYFVGLTGTPSFELVENHWGLRAVEKTPEDLWKFSSARDLGVASKGSYADGLFAYNLMIGNGSGINHEINSGKRAYLSLSSEPIKSLLLEVYGDYESNTHDMVKHVFAGYKVEGFRVGVLYSHIKQWTAAKKAFSTYNVTSLYAVAKVIDKLDAFVRFDRLSDAGLGVATYLRQSSTARPTLYIAGVDYEVTKNVHFMPNAELVTYPTGTDSDLIPRLTFAWNF